MWLINVETLQLEFFNTSERPPYTILSHTWNGEEVTFQQFQNQSSWGKTEQTPQFRKIIDCCKLTQKDGYKYTWVDTCCIDKTNSAELSEAINSMFKWYNRATICYVYLSEFQGETQGQGYLEGFPLTLRDELLGSAWFWRGWTLQELIAPPEVYFFDRAWRFVAARSKIADVLSDITGIDVSVLQWPELASAADYGDVPAAQLLLQDKVAVSENHTPASTSKVGNSRASRFEPSYQSSLLGALRTHLDRYTIAQRMSWAANRETTRIEDRAYSLLGIFDISLPLVYGEGSKAFFRLQEEIMKSSTDHSILAWIYVDSSVETYARLKDSGSKYGWLLAPSPDYFSAASKIVYYRTLKETEGFSFEMTNLGLRIYLPVVESKAVLNCAMSNNLTGPLALCLTRGAPVGYYVDNKVSAVNSRVQYSSRLTVVPREELQNAKPQNLILLRDVTAPKEDMASKETGFRIRGDHPGFKVHIVDSVPRDYGFGGEASKYAISLPFAKDCPNIAALRIELETDDEYMPYAPTAKLDIVFGVDADNVDSLPGFWANSAPYVRAFRSNENKLSTRRQATLSGITDAKKNSSWKIQKHTSVPLSRDVSLEISIRKESTLLWCVSISSSRTLASVLQARRTVVDDAEDFDRKQRSIEQRRMKLYAITSMVAVWLALGLVIFALVITNRKPGVHAHIEAPRPGL